MGHRAIDFNGPREHGRFADELWVRYGVGQFFGCSEPPPPPGFARAPAAEEALHLSAAISDFATCFSEEDEHLRRARLARRHYYCAAIFARDRTLLPTRAADEPLPSAASLALGAFPARGPRSAATDPEVRAASQVLFALAEVQLGDRVQIVDPEDPLDGRKGLVVRRPGAWAPARKRGRCAVLLDEDWASDDGAMQELAASLFTPLPSPEFAVPEAVAASCEVVHESNLRVILKRKMSPEQAVSQAWLSINPRIVDLVRAEGAGGGADVYFKIHALQLAQREEADLRRAIELDPRWRVPYVQLAALLEATGLQPGGLRAVERAGVAAGVFAHELQWPLVAFGGLRAHAWWAPGPRPDGAGPGADDGALDAASSQLVRELEDGFVRVVLPEFERARALFDGLAVDAIDGRGQKRPGGDWGEIQLFRHEEDDEFSGGEPPDAAGRQHFPETRRLVERVAPYAASMAWVLAGDAKIKRLAPGTRLEALRGLNNGRLTAHLALEVPSEAAAATVRVGAERRPWRVGEVLLFDDSFGHDFVNGSESENCTVLELHLLHPDSDPLFGGDCMRYSEEAERLYHETMYCQVGVPLGNEAAEEALFRDFVQENDDGQLPTCPYCRAESEDAHPSVLLAGGCAQPQAVYSCCGQVVV